MKFRTKFSRVEDTSPYPAPEEVYNIRIWLMMLSAGMSAAMFGYDGAFIGSTLKLPAFKHTFGLTDAEGAKKLAALTSQIVSTFQAGCFFGTLSTYPLVERFGIKPCFFLASFLFCLGSILQTVSTGSLGLIYGGRALTGLAVGNAYLLGPAYVAMNSPPAVRGKMVGLLETVYQAFSVIGFWVNYGVNENISATSNAQWRIPVAFQLVPGSLLGILMFFQPEAPRWLMSKGREEEAISNLCYLRKLPQDHPYIRFEIEQIKEQIDSERVNGVEASFVEKLKQSVGPLNRNRLGLGLAMMLLQNLSGINALNYYSSTLIQNIGFTGTSVSLLATGVYGLEKALVTLVFMTFFVDTAGRRKALLFGSIGAALGMYYLGIYTHVADTFDHPPPKDAGAIMGLVAVYWYTFHYAYSWNGIPFMFCAEVFPNQIRMLCMTMTTCMQWLAQFMIVYSLPYMVVSIKSFTFIFFAVCTTFSFIFTLLFVPETKVSKAVEIERERRRMQYRKVGYQVASNLFSPPPLHRLLCSLSADHRAWF
ncbi:putative sugar transporter [Violaceomyces palustris]|uniref:Sugar transporter n=1 Tax=Violaceomyces palustris TaxID=1673888 RepID=A0ACD0NVV7_9BASI|nr:putative sugar transporter [Violaceomyces palustris]